MLRKLSLAAVAAASLGGPRWRRPPPLPGAVGTMAAGIIMVGAGVARASLSAAPLITAAMAAAMCGGWLPTPWGPRWRLVNRCY